MGAIELLLLALALALDAFAVSVATGLAMRCTIVQTLRMALAFGAFQFFMPVLGWFLGVSVRNYIESFDHWVAFALLTLIGLNMLRGALGDKGEDSCADPTKGPALLILAIATSIDALAVGVSMAVLGLNIWLPAVVIGVVCFLVSAAGIRLGRLVVREGSTLAEKANIVGGLVLIGIGVKILWEHGVFA